MNQYSFQKIISIAIILFRHTTSDVSIMSTFASWDILFGAIYNYENKLDMNQDRKCSK